MHGLLASSGFDGGVLQALALFFAPFLHESLAFVTGAFLIHAQKVGPLLCGTVLLAGIIASDLAVYGLGVLARRHRRIAALVPKASKPALMLDRQLPWLIPVCHLVPGLLFTTFVSCGVLGLGFRRFAAIAAATALVYTPLMLYLVLHFGAAIAAPGHFWPWVGLFLGLMVVTSAVGWLITALLERMPSWPSSAGG